MPVCFAKRCMKFTSRGFNGGMTPSLGVTGANGRRGTRPRPKSATSARNPCVIPSIDRSFPEAQPRAINPSWIPACAGMTLIRYALTPIVPPRAFLGALRRLLRGLLSDADLAEHVDDDEVGDYRRRFFAQPARVASVPGTAREVAKEHVLRVIGPHRVGVVGAQRVRDEAAGSSLPRLVPARAP